MVGGQPLAEELQHLRQLGGVGRVELRLGHGGSGVLGGFAAGEPVGLVAGFDDGAIECESVDDGAQPRLGEGLGPAIRGWHLFGLRDPGRCLGCWYLGMFADL